MPEPIRELVLLEAAVYQGRGTGLRRPKAWLLHFGPDLAARHHAIDPGRTSDTPPPLAALCIAGTLPGCVQCVQVHRQGKTIYQIDSVTDGRTGSVAAGELVAAIAQVCGDTGMTIDITHHGLAWAQAGVSVLVEADSAADAEQLRVSLR